MNPLRCLACGLIAASILTNGPASTKGETASNSTATQQPTKVASNDGPRIEFLEPAFDFGRVQCGKIVKHVFEFTNAGNQVLEIRDVWTSCGCTAATNWTRQVAPGKLGSIPVIFDSSGRAGVVTKTVSVVCNDPAQPKLVLQFNATVWKPIDALPGVVAFSFGPDFQTNQSRLVHLVSNLDGPVTISEPVCTNNSFRARVKTLKPGKEFELEVTVVPPVAPGSTVAPITLNTSSSEMPVVLVNAYAMVQPALTVNPPRLRLAELPLAEAAQFKVRIQNQSTNSLDLSDPSVSGKGAQARLREIQPGKLFELTVDFPKGFRNQPGQEMEVRVKSNHTQMPYVRIPVLEPVASAGEPTAGSSELSRAQEVPASSGGKLP